MKLKKKTGTIVDEYGNIINKDIINNNTENMDNNKEELIFNNRNKNKIDKVKTDYKDIKSYNPSGNLIYSNNLLKKLDINS